MAMRELVTGGAACAVPGTSSSSSNPLGALASALVGPSSKTQERLKEIPTSAPTPEANFYSETDDHLRALPGSEFDQSLLPPNAQGSEFLHGFHFADQSGFADAWDEIQQERQAPPFNHFDDRGPVPQLQPTLDGSPQRVLSSFLHSFVESSRGGIPFRPVSLPLLGLSEGDKRCIRDRSSIMARHFFADKSEDFISAQVNLLLSSLEIDKDARARGPLPGKFRELEDYWNESQGIFKPVPHAADGWVSEYSQHRAADGDPDAWAHAFEQQHGASGWASEFEREQILLTDQMRGGNIPNLAAMEQTRMLAHTLAQNNDPKFQVYMIHPDLRYP